MYLANALLRELDQPGLSVDRRAILRCRLAKQLEQTGDYEAAGEALAELWRGIGSRPILDGLQDETRGEVLLRAGALTGWLGRARQVEGSQETAKDLISESVRVFSDLGIRNKVGEARSELALCYWRAGAFDEARVILQDALTELGEGDIEQRATAILRKAIVEKSSTRLNDALNVYEQATPLFADIEDHLLTAHFHHGFANVLNELSSAEHRQEFVDRALIEYSAAAFHFERAGHARYQACVDINLGYLFFTLNRFSEAHEHLDRAQVLLTKLKDNLHLARVDETRARVLLAEGRLVEAEKAVRSAVHEFEKGDELSWLAEALTTHGITLARLIHPDQARETLERAIKVAEQAGDFESAGLAALTLIEQLGPHLSTEDVRATMDYTEVLLEKTQDLSTLRRLAKAFRALNEVLVPTKWTEFSLRKAVRRYESHLIKLALAESGGSVSRAARLLGFNHHQSLASLIQARHKDLLSLRSAVRKRRHHLLVHPKRKRKKPDLAKQATDRISILHVEDNDSVARLVKETLESKGWKVETCGDGDLGLQKIASDARYDLIVLDHELPGRNGLELIDRARRMPHRRQTPVVMLSATVDDDAARQAGADAGLRKPEEISALTDTISRLLDLPTADEQPAISTSNATT
jgi:two-component system, chemotaxis family, chemotaxis protein CheY